MKLYKTEAEASASAPAGYEFIPLGRLDYLPLPVAMSAAVAALRHSS